MLCIDALIDYCLICLILMDGLEVTADEPHKGVEPLNGLQHLHQQQVVGVSQPYVFLLMGEDVLAT